MTALIPVTAAWTMVRPGSDRPELPGGQVLAGAGPGPERGVVGHDQQHLGAVAGELAGVARVGRLPADQGPTRTPSTSSGSSRSPGTLS